MGERPITSLEMAELTGLEPATSGVTDRRELQLHHSSMVFMSSVLRFSQRDSCNIACSYFRLQEFTKTFLKDYFFIDLPTKIR